MFSKDDEGCITAEELKFVLTHLPGKVGWYKHIICEKVYSRVFSQILRPKFYLQHLKLL